MSKVIVALKGGLGNQIFQYAAGLDLSVRLGAELVLDISPFSDYRQKHFYALAPFEIPERLQENDNYLWRRGGLVDSVFRRVSRKFAWKRCGVPVKYETTLGFDPTVLELAPPVMLDGYWQSERYFSNVAESIRNRFGTPRRLSEASQAMLKSIQECDAICIHVRRGDYVTNPVANQFHGLCGMDYYQQGIELVAEKDAKSRCFIFSDDPDWVRENMRLALPTVVVDINGTNQAHQDLWLMAACKKFVIANSSLSWWAAWLGQHPQKKVVAPLQWFKGSTKDTNDLIPSEWLRA